MPRTRFPCGLLIDGKQAKLSTRVGKGSAVYLAAVLEVRDSERSHAIMVLLTRREIVAGWDGTPLYPVKDSVACTVASIRGDFSLTLISLSIARSFLCCKHAYTLVCCR